MKRILLVGGAGYIGGATYDLLIKKGYDVTIFDNLIYETRFLKPCNFIYGDIRETEKLINISKEFNIIIWLAALVGDAACQVDVNFTHQINYLSVKSYLEKLPDNKQFIFISTCSVYGAQNEVLNELSQTNPLSAYANTKLMAEQEVINFGGMIFRLGTVYGKGDDHSRIRFDLVVNVLTLKSVINQEIYINGGDQWRPIISVNDVAGYIAEGCNNYCSDIFILSRENVLLKDLGIKVAKCVPNTKLVFNEIPFQDFRNYKVDNSKSLNFFKYKPQYSVEHEVGILMKIIKEKRVMNPNDPIYHNGSFLNLNKEILLK